MKRLHHAVAGLLLFAAGLTATVAEAQDLYDSGTLQSWQPRYQRSTLRIFNEALLPALTAAEGQRLGSVPPVEFPLRPTVDDYAGHPLAFYALASPRVIVMPISSLKFLDDICTAYAWLQLNGYAIETVSEYSAILRFAKEPAGGFPPPLTALSVPANALDNKDVDQLALLCFNSARAFLLAHELAHVLYAHRANARDREQSRRNEAEADEFAYRLLARTSLPPFGVVFFLMADAHWSHIAANPDATHPLSGARLKAAARRIGDPELADLFERLGAALDDPDIRLGFVATGKAGDLAALAPRRPGDLPRRTAAGRSGDAEIDGAFHGLYSGSITQAPDPGEIPVEVAFERTGSRVTGVYTVGLGFGRIDGTVAGNRLEFEWEFAQSYGRGVIESADGRSFSGTWGYRGAAHGAGTWTGRR